MHSILFLVVPTVTSIAINECGRQYEGYCIDIHGSCQSGYTLSYSHCNFLQFCCHPFWQQTSFGSQGLPTETGSQTTAILQGLFPHSTQSSMINSNLILTPDACGKSLVDKGHRIVGGGQAEPHEYPWQVSLRYRGRHMCGGTLIDDQWILTAAHCFKQAYGNYWTVGVGLHDIYHVHYSHVISADRIFTHSGFSKSNVNDIALVRLSRRVDTSHRDTRTACLPDRRERFDSLMCTVTGWGVTQSDGHVQRYLQEVDVPILSNDLCSYYMGSAIHPSNICAGYKQGGKDACQGDSGGPLVCKKGDVWKIAGVVSWGIGCGVRNSPGVYTRVSAYLDWIEGVLAG